MYENDEKDDFNRTNPEEHKEETESINFTMRDPDQICEPEEVVRQAPAEPAGQLPPTVQPAEAPVQAEGRGCQNPPRPPYGTGAGYQEGHGSGAAARENRQYDQTLGNSSHYQESHNREPHYQEPHYQEARYQEPHYQEAHYQKAPYQGNQYQETGYRDQQYQQGGYTYGNIPYEPKPKKKGGFLKKAAAVVGAALVFGVVSGSVMVGINWVAGGYAQKQNLEVSKAETLPSAAQNESGSQNTGGASAVVSGMDVSAIADKAMPSVVAITSKVIYESQTWFGLMQQEGTGSGSGIIVGQNDNELLIVTNNHVVQGAEELKVTFIDNIAVDAAIKGTDSDTDLAVIAVQLKDIPADTLSQITIANMGNSDSLKVGQGVVAIGNALGYGQSVTVGYISALSREVKTEGGVSKDLLQTDAAINPGNSGGALLNMQGELIGINSAKYSSTEVEGMGYAIPISKAQDIINELMTKKTRTQVAEGSEGYLGIQCKNIDSNTSQQLGMPQGVFIYKIVEGGAASKSDLREKDIITKFDGQSIKSYDDLTNMLKYYEAGATITVTVQSLENGQYVERQVDLTLDKKPVQESQQAQQR